MSKIDFKKTLRDLYRAPRGKFKQVDVPQMQYLMIDGRGDPATAAYYQEAIEALYAVAFKIKFASKKTLERDYVVPPLEGLWGSEMMVSTLGEAASIEDWLEIFQASNRDEWSWTMMIMQPEWVEQSHFEAAVEQVWASKDLAAIDALRMDTLDEGLCVQTMHIGPYIDEGPILAEMHVLHLPSESLIENGSHHEIYLSDPRRVAPEKLKTILRQPVRAAQ